MSQNDQYQSAPPPGYSPEPGYGQPGYQTPKTNTMAILGLVFAFIFSPLGVVFSAIGLKQIKERREGGRGLALAGLIISIISIVLGILLLVLSVTVLAPAVKKAAEAQSAASASSAAGSSADTHGVVAACQAIVPAVVHLQSDLSTVETPADYASVMGSLRTTIEGAAARTTDPTFVAHVQTLSGDFQKAVDAVNAGEDPSSLESALNADGTQIDKDCSAAGYHQ